MPAVRTAKKCARVQHSPTAPRELVKWMFTCIRNTTGVVVGKRLSTGWLLQPSVVGYLITHSYMQVGARNVFWLDLRR